VILRHRQTKIFIILFYSFVSFWTQYNVSVDEERNAEKLLKTQITVREKKGWIEREKKSCDI
jgi:hypothetical protein